VPMIANRRRSGKTLRKSSSRLPARSGAWTDSPVMLPPGRARLATRPPPTGSPAAANTIGITDVACLAASTAPPRVTITSTLSPTNSVAISAKRSGCPSAQRYSIATVRPSIQPSSRNLCTREATDWLSVASVPKPKYPMVGSFVACCARAASGHAAAPPSSVMKSRLFIRSPRRRWRAERYPQIFGWRHDPRAYLFFYTLDRTSPLPRSSQEARIPDQRPLVQSPPISRHPEALRRYRRANCCPHAIRSVEPYQGHYRHTLCATFPRRQSREWCTRTQCEPGRVFDF